MVTIRVMIVALFMPGVANRGSPVSAKMAYSVEFVIFYSCIFIFSIQGIRQPCPMPCMQSLRFSAFNGQPCYQGHGRHPCLSSGHDL